MLIVEDDASMRELLAAILKDYTLYEATTFKEAVALLERYTVHITLLDIRLPDGDGMELLKRIKDKGESNEVIMISSVRDIPTVVKAIKMGAYDYINKDFEYEDIRVLVARAVQVLARERELLYLRSEISQYTDVDYITGKGNKQKQIDEIVHRAAQVPAPVLLSGERGTGKETVARRIHALGGNAQAPFVAVTISAIPSDELEVALFGEEPDDPLGRVKHGKFELASGGTLFLDEIGEIRNDLQVRILKAIEEGKIERVGGHKAIPIQVRIISATYCDLDRLITEGRFREDLYYRLNVLPIALPPLRERLDDIPAFLALFIKKAAGRYSRPTKGVSPRALDILRGYNWPGNIRELENLVEQMVALHDREILNERDIPIEYQVYQLDELKKTGEEDLIKAATDAFERNFILNVLEKENWNQTRTSERLGIHRKTLEYKIKRLNLGEIIDLKR